MAASQQAQLANSNLSTFYFLPSTFFRVLIIFLAALAVSAVALWVYHVKGGVADKSPILEIRDSASGKVYGRWPLDESGEFSVEFIHSVHKDPVRETFRAEDKMIKLQAVRFYSFGAGMQSDLGEGQVLSRDGDAMVITGYTASFKALNYIIGTVSDHLLIINNEVFSLRELCGRNVHVTVRIK